MITKQVQDLCLGFRPPGEAAAAPESHSASFYRKGMCDASLRWAQTWAHTWAAQAAAPLSLEDDGFHDNQNFFES